MMALRSEQQLCHHYSIADIQLATQNFHDSLIVGEGGFGKVYRGNIKSETGGSTVVAIKRLDSISTQGAPEFKAEIEMLSKLRHSHLVSLLGCCVDGKEMIIVYEYMTHGTVSNHLHNSKTPLSWMQRLKISIGAARGLDYLHDGARGTKHGVIHRDMKSSNILLDEDLEAKISDFGLAKLCPINQSYTYVNTGIKGTFGYMDPEIFMTGKFTRKTDVYAFGVVLFELLSGRHAVLPDDDENLSLARWARKCVKRRNLDQLVAAEVRGKQLSPKSLKEFSQIAYRCLDRDPKERPKMSEVVSSLQQSLALQKKFDNCAKSEGLFRFNWKMPSYFVPLTKENSGHGDKKSSQNSSECSSIPIENYDDYSAVLPDSEELLAQKIIIFRYTDLVCATRNFQNQVKIHQKWVFIGWVNGKTYSPCKFGLGLAITVEKLLHRPQSDLQLLGEFIHPNLQRLIGYCFEDGILYLVHEFMEKKSLADYMHMGAEAELPFIMRIKIVVGVARCLVFLQHKRLVIRDWMLDLDEIWLDKDFNAKLICFDVATLLVSQSVQAPLKYTCSFGVRRCNVYGLGILLMEMLTGRYFVALKYVNWVKKNNLSGNVVDISDKMIKNIVDRRMKLDASQIERARELVSLMLRLTEHHYTMAHALEELQIIYGRMTEQ